MNEKSVKSVLQLRNELQRKAERGEISPAQYYAGLQKKGEKMTKKEKETELTQLRRRGK
jgi:hypothetical protein